MGEPLRAIAFFDAQNLFHGVRSAFGHTWPNYDPHALAARVCAPQGWQLKQVRHYTGFPAEGDDPFWHAFWINKQAAMASRGIHTFGRLLKYRSQVVEWPDHTPVMQPDGMPYVRRVAHEKGIDIRIALDVVRLALARAYEVALLFTQDQDLSEAVVDVKSIASLQKRWITLASAFPCLPVKRNNNRGVNGTDWIPLSQADYEASLDPNDYRPKARSGAWEGA